MPIKNITFRVCRWNMKTGRHIWNNLLLFILTITFSACPPNKDVNEIETDFGVTVNSIIKDNIYNDPHSYFRDERNIEIIEDVTTCEKLRKILIENSEKPVYIKLEKSLSLDVHGDNPACTQKEPTFLVKRNSEIIIDGGGEFLISQTEPEKSQKGQPDSQESTPLIKIINNRRVFLKGFKLLGGRTGVEKNLHSTVYLIDVDIINPVNNGVLITEDNTIVNQTSHLDLIRIAHATNGTCNKNHGDDNTVVATSDACTLTITCSGINCTRTISTNGTGINITTANATVIIPSGVTVTISKVDGDNLTMGVNLQNGKLKIEGNGKLIIRDYVTGISMNNGHLICDKRLPKDHIVFERSDNKPFTFTAINELNTCVRNVGNFNGNGNLDMAWEVNSTNNLKERTWIYLEFGEPKMFVQSPGWAIAGIGDFDGNGIDDIFWRHTDGSSWLYYFELSDDGTLKQKSSIRSVSVDTKWQVAGVGDFNRDGKDDLFWVNVSTDRKNYISLMGIDMGSPVTIPDVVSSIPPPPGSELHTSYSGWDVMYVDDLDHDGIDDVLWKNHNLSSYYIYLIKRDRDGIFSKEGITNTSLSGNFSGSSQCIDIDNDNKDAARFVQPNTNNTGYYINNNNSPPVSSCSVSDGNEETLYKSNAY